MTVTDLLNRAGKAIGKVRAGGGLSPTELADGLDVLNAVVDWFTTRKAFVYTVRADEYTLSGKAPPDAYNPAVYQLGPTSADWPGSTRPTRIEDANIILTASSPGTFYPLQLLDEKEWAAIRLEQLPTALPLQLYCDYANPNANLYFWGQPTAGLILQLFTWQQAGSFASLNTTIVVPPGYSSAFLYTAAELLGPQWNHDVPARVTKMAMDARAGVQGLNSLAPRMATRDAGMPQGRNAGRSTTFNYRTRSY